MKKLTIKLIASLLICSINTNAQTNTGKIDSLTDFDGRKYSYIGEIKNKLPNGIGVAMYPEKSGLSKYAGNFVNGFFEGKGVMLLENDDFISCNWERGKLLGQVTRYKKNNLFVVSEYENSAMNGKSTTIYDDGQIMEALYKNNKLEGRGIIVNDKWDIIYDNKYENGNSNGQGYEYELSKMQLLEGIWKDDVFQNTTTNNYPTFLKDPLLKRNLHKNFNLIVGRTNLNDSKTLTGILYNKQTKTRQYGTFVDEKLTQGITIVDGVSKAIGQFNDTLLNGFGHLTVKNKSYDKKDTYYGGEFKNGTLTGNKNIVIALGTLTISFGSFEYFSETNYLNEIETRIAQSKQGWKCGEYNDLQIGEFSEGVLYGKGMKITTDGYCINGIWAGDDLKELISLTNDKGELINTKANTLQEALSIVKKTYVRDGKLWGIVNGLYQGDEKFGWAGDSYYGLVKFPQSEEVNYIAKSEFYTAVYKITSDFIIANEKYNQLCNEIKGLKILEKPLTTEGKINQAKAKNDFTITTFTNNDGSEFYVSVLLYKEKNSYKVAVISGPKLPLELLKAEE